MRISATSWFVAAAIVVAGVVGYAARSAPRADASTASGIPADAERVGFVVRGRTREVALLDATRPFRLELGNGPLMGSTPDVASRDRAQAIVVRELARYSPALLRATKLRGVVFVHELMEGKKAIPSLPNVAGLLLLDVDAAERDLVRTIHHEVFHFFDLADDGALSPDATWERLNAEGFTYGAGGRTLRGAWAAARPEGLGGFVSAYATSAVEEDKAETFAFAVARRDDLVALAANDPVLDKKVRELARRLDAVEAGTARALGVP